MKVLHIAGATSWGGNEQQIVDILPELEKLNVENIVFGVGNSVFHRECINNNIKFVSSKSKKLNKIVNYYYLKTIVDRIKPDLIHLHTSDSLTVFMISDLLFGLRTKAVFSKKGMGSSGSIFSKLKYNYSGLNSIICVSRSVQNDFSKMLNRKNIDKLKVIHDCVSEDILHTKESLNIRERYNIEPNKLIVGNIGNHTKAKNLETFINVADKVVNKMNRKDVYFVQIGEFSKLTEPLIQSVKQKGLGDNFIFTNKIKNASSLNRQFDLFLLTSEREGGPTSILESMLLGTPIISTEVGVIPEIIENGINGFFEPVKNHDLLAEKVSLLLSNKNLQNQFSLRNVDLVKKEFLAPFIAKETFLEYSNILKVDPIQKVQ